MKEQVAERIKVFRRHVGLSVADLAAILGKGTPAIYAIEQGRVFPQVDDLATLQESHGLNLNWIVSGKGSPVIPSSKDKHAPESLKELVAALREDPGNDELAIQIDQQLTITLEKLEKLKKVYNVLKDTR